MERAKKCALPTWQNVPVLAARHRILVFARTLIILRATRQMAFGKIQIPRAQWAFVQRQRQQFRRHNSQLYRLRQHQRQCQLVLAVLSILAQK